MRNNIQTFLPIFVLLSACAMGESIDDGTDEPSSIAISLPSGDAARVLDLVNYPGTDAATLDTLAKLDTRAAAHIIAYRNGGDGITPSADDQRFDDVAELDAIPYVGDVAFEKLVAYSATNPAPAAESVESVYFQGWEAEAVIWGVNQATAAELDAVIDARAANTLATHADFTTVSEMGPVTYVGPVVLEQLRAYAPAWWARMRGEDLGGSYDGVAFDDMTAYTALEIANYATVDQLVAHGMWRTGAQKIVAAGPYATLAQVAAVDGVGTATMRALHDYAASGTWTSLDAAP